MEISAGVPTIEQLEKYDRLKACLKSFQSVAVAFSSGVDSALLLYAAKEALGEHAVAVTAASGAFPKRELAEAKDFCAEHGILQEIVEFREMEVEGFRENPKNRCYLCKKALFQEIRKAAAAHGIDTVAEGSNLDDLGDYRPGLTAIAELGIESPLRSFPWSIRRNSSCSISAFRSSGSGSTDCLPGSRCCRKNFRSFLKTGCSS